ncbi:cyclase [Salinadaptatus halalkaliphilus]|uniref:Cyclase n=1 Tax=Salinadaptatus halalkaliphilus TaxID=2419781 RepID=A0A4S3TFL8_9EURY|nr:cyclase [Salinadaptatus halalkaliphilus]THE62714.1 cyclase [Salinadaptatus halalkaliphilus]
MVSWECPIKPREASGLDPEAVHAYHVIEEYERWERFHEANAETRAAHGSLGTQVYRKCEDPTTLLVIQEIDDDRLEEALEYFDSEAFQSMLERAGVVDVPESGLLEQVHEQTV